MAQTFFEERKQAQLHRILSLAVGRIERRQRTSEAR